VVIEKKFEDIRPAKDHVADFGYQPIKCSREDRIVVLRKGSTVGGRGRCSPDNAPSPEPAPGPARIGETASSPTPLVVAAIPPSHDGRRDTASSPPSWRFDKASAA